MPDISCDLEWHQVNADIALVGGWLDMKDAEEGEAHPRSIGFANLSEFIDRDKDRSIALYRGYLSLASRDLLYRQSELNNLREQLARYDAEDAENARGGKREFKDMAMDWQLLCEGLPNSPAGRRKKLILDIREHLKEYRPWFSSSPSKAPC